LCRTSCMATSRLVSSDHVISITCFSRDPCLCRRRTNGCFDSLQLLYLLQESYVDKLNQVQQYSRPLEWPNPLEFLLMVWSIGTLESTLCDYVFIVSMCRRMRGLSRGPW
jgi:hypothetical protein